MKLIEVKLLRKVLSKKEKVKIVLILLSFVVAFLFIKIFPLNRYDFYPPCPFNFLTSWYCPGCGSMRGISGSLQGQWWSMWYNNKLVVFLSPLILLGLINLIMPIVNGKKVSISVKSPWIGRIFIIVIIIYWILRNFIPSLAPIE